METLVAPMPLPWSPQPAAVGGRIGRARRYVTVGAILVRSGVLGRWRVRTPGAEAALGRSARAACERAGGLYVKLGQLLSTRPDLVPAGVAAELGRLQSAVAPVPARRVARVVDEELGGPPGSVFRAFDTRPVAAASVAQVHRATLADGRPVAVKVQRPEVGARIRADVDILIRLAELLERRTRWAADQRVTALVRGLADSLVGELDFAAEACNLRALRRAVAGHDRVVVPAPVPALTARRVLVMDWVEGRPLAEAAGSLAPGERTALARALIACFLDQIFVSGTFHVDPHPGNVHLTATGDIALLDCGAVGRLDRRQRAGMQDLLVAVAGRDGAAMAAALTALAVPAASDPAAGRADAVTALAVPPTSDSAAGNGNAAGPRHAPTDAGGGGDRGARERLVSALDHLLADHLPPGASPGPALFGSLVRTLAQAGLSLDPMVYGALRAVATLQTTLTALAPDLDPVAEASALPVALAA